LNPQYILITGMALVKEDLGILDKQAVAVVLACWCRHSGDGIRLSRISAVKTSER
jgi:hypothetical protein